MFASLAKKLHPTMDFTTEESEDGEDEGLNPQSGTP